MRSEEPQSFRDLALALIRRGEKNDLERAMEYLQQIVFGTWDIRFDQIEIIAMMDLNRAISIYERKGFAYQNQKSVSVDKRLLRMLDLDIRVVISWDYDMLHVEMNCLEPRSENCSTFQNQTRNGGLLSKSFTRGYGPQEYMIRKAIPGQFDFFVKIFSPLIPADSTSFVSVKIFSNFGRINEIEKINLVNLSVVREKKKCSHDKY